MCLGDGNSSGPGNNFHWLKDHQNQGVFCTSLKDIEVMMILLILIHNRHEFAIVTEISCHLHTFKFITMPSQKVFRNVLQCSAAILPAVQPLAATM